MFTNYIKTSWRSLLKHRLFTVINLLGLALGLMVTIVILTYVHAELTCDNFHANGDQIYRVIRQAEVNANEYRIGITSAPFGPALKNDFPASITDFVRVMPDEGLVAHEQRAFMEKKFFLADRNFFEIFSFPLAKGDPATVLANPNSVVLTAEMAKKYFGDTDPLGKTLTLDNRYEFMVTGVLAENKHRSHLDFDFVAGLEVYRERDWYNDWWGNTLFTYVRIASREDARQVEAGLAAFIDKYLGEDFKRNRARVDPKLQPLAEIYFQKDIRYDPALHGDKNAVYLFCAIAAFILLLACINYMNLTTARAGRRAREIGVRKALGAHRVKLVLQFFAESLLLTASAILLALVGIELLLPYLNSTFGLELSIALTHPAVVLLLLTLLLAVSSLASSYPALLLSSFKPVTVLKSQTGVRVQGISVRKALVVFQFCVAIALIIGTLVIGRQLDYMRNKQLGFDEAHVVLAPMNNREMRSRQEDFVARVRAIPGVISASAMSGEPGGFHDTMSFGIEGSEQNWRMRTVFADHDYVKTLGMKIVAGRDFSRAFGTDAAQAILLNETAVKMLGWTNEQALGKTIRNIMLDTTRSQVVGVIGDYHFSSLKDAIEPLAVAIRPWRGMLAFKIESRDLQKTLAALEQQWKSFSPAFPFEFSFLDESLDQLYRHEQRESTLFRLFGFLAIFIACLGLFGLAAFAAEQRGREIGIRKVLGASIASVTGLLSREFVKLVLLANVIAWPVAYFAMNKWLENFAYRVSLEWWLFALAGGLALLIALLTVSTQAIRAALANPVETLRYE
jgi:putative ABC transport system permease protein